MREDDGNECIELSGGRNKKKEVVKNNGYK
jgi:hypothetical protein